MGTYIISYRICMIIMLHILLSYLSFFYFFFAFFCCLLSFCCLLLLGLLNCCQFSAVVKSQQQREREKERERRRQLCPSFICPFIIATCRSLPICATHMQQQRATHAAGCCRQLVSSFNPQNFCHTHTRTQLGHHFHSVFPFCIFHFNCLSFQLSFPLFSYIVLFPIH